MPGSKSDYLEKQILDLVLGDGAFTKPGTVYLALSTAAFSEAATGSAMTEVAGGAYTRVAVTNNLANFPDATGTGPASKTTGTVITFPTASASWGSVTAFYILDAAAAGNVLYGGDLATPKTVAAGDTASFAAGAITITED